MLTSCTSETDRKAGESSLHISFDRCIYQSIGMFQKWEYLTVILKECNYWLIESCKWFISLIFSRVINGTAVEYKAHHFHSKLTLLKFIGELLEVSEFTENFTQIWIFRIIFLK